MYSAETHPTDGLLSKILRPMAADLDGGFVKGLRNAPRLSKQVTFPTWSRNAQRLSKAAISRMVTGFRVGGAQPYPQKLWIRKAPCRRGRVKGLIGMAWSVDTARLARLIAAGAGMPMVSGVRTALVAAQRAQNHPRSRQRKPGVFPRPACITVQQTLPAVALRRIKLRVVQRHGLGRLAGARGWSGSRPAPSGRKCRPFAPSGYRLQGPGKSCGNGRVQRRHVRST